MINTFIKKPHSLRNVVGIQKYMDNFDSDKLIINEISTTKIPSNRMVIESDVKVKIVQSNMSNNSEEM